MFYDNYLWYDCFPRWCGSHEKMKAFAERCYETRRHDTMVPYFYAEALLKVGLQFLTALRNNEFHTVVLYEL